MERIAKQISTRCRRPLFDAFWSEWRRCRSDRERGLTSYILFTLNDRLVADLGTEWLFALLRRAPAELRVAEVLEFIAAKGRRGHGEVLSCREDNHQHRAEILYQLDRFRTRDRYRS